MGRGWLHPRAWGGIELVLAQEFYRGRGSCWGYGTCLDTWMMMARANGFSPMGLGKACCCHARSSQSNQQTMDDLSIPCCSSFTKLKDLVPASKQDTGFSGVLTSWGFACCVTVPAPQVSRASLPQLSHSAGDVSCVLPTAPVRSARPGQVFWGQVPLHLAHLQPHEPLSNPTNSQQLVGLFKLSPI